ncbi:glycoside hydrolase family 15 protein [Nakamurella lactea]|uniref:glycoside hydrolase family 15 protein n=1 Tax=Nakamurella lactea TaxID=459515 RepID=UPI0009FE8E4F|nr:glycoside hydrolase family 15 protein [Nakamurella lactea]
MTPRATPAPVAGQLGAAEFGPFAPQTLRQYALLADGIRGALIGPRGDVSWMCVPRWDSDAVFCSLIGGLGGYAITPTDRHVWGGYYEEGSLIWRSRWVLTDGLIECREALAFPGRTDRAVLLRRVTALNGDARVRVLLSPRAGYGRHQFTALHRDDSGWTARSGPLRLRLTGADGARPDGTRNDRWLVADLVVPEGTHHDLVLEIGDQELTDDPVDPRQAWQQTENAWRAEVPALDNCIGAGDARRSYAVLRGLTSPGGGMVAAATTSLPERASAGRNYDYRYVWIRDQCYTGVAAAAAGGTALLDAAVGFVAGRLIEHGDQLRPAYTTEAGRVPDQRELDLPGYPGGHNLVGNWVNRQFQLDAFGESLVLFAAAARDDRMDGTSWQAADVAATAIADRWTEPDAGIWEIDNRNWTHSRLACVAGLRSLAAAGAPAARAAEWVALADRILAETDRTGLHATGYWQRSPDDLAVDGSLLLPPLRGAFAADDPRTVATLEVYARDLVTDGYAYRFRHDDRQLAEAEGSFTLCGFTMAMALHQQGRAVAARGWFERTRAVSGPPALYSEEYDVAQHQLRGNIPQAFVHALHLESAARLAGPPSQQE